MNDKQSQTILTSVAVQRQLADQPGELWRKISIQFDMDSADAVFKAPVR